MLQQRWETKIHRKEISLQLGLKLTTTKSWVLHAHDWATRVGSKGIMIDWLIDWMVFYAVFNSISVISQWQLTLFMSFLGFASTRLGSEVFCQRTLPRKSESIMTYDIGWTRQKRIHTCLSFSSLLLTLFRGIRHSKLILGSRVYLQRCISII